MILDEHAIRALPMDTMVLALRRWHEQTGNRVPSAILAELAPHDTAGMRRAVLLAKVRRAGPITIPTIDNDDFIDALEGASQPMSADTRKPYPRDRGYGPTPAPTGG